METIQVYTNKVTTEPEDSNQLLVTINNVSVDDIVPQFTANDLLKAIDSHYGTSVIAQWLADGCDEE